MKLTIAVGVVCTLAGVRLQADSIAFSSGAAWVNWSSTGFSTGQANPVENVQGTPFWNNWSTDTGTLGSHDMNIGYMLTDSGGFAGTPAVLGTDSVSQALLGNNGSDPSSFTFNADPSESYTTTVLGAYSSMNSGPNGTVFGWYDIVGGVPILHPLYSAIGMVTTPGMVLSFPTTLDSGDTSFGFYATVCYNNLVSNCSAYSETYFTNSALNRGALGNSTGASYNHFAVFDLTSNPSSDFVIAFKDGPLSTEGLGDFNDLVIEFSDPSSNPLIGPISPIPEPASMSLVGFGLVALAFAGRRLSSAAK
jgi:PEP-CTERM motif-containing protein